MKILNETDKLEFVDIFRFLEAYKKGGIYVNIYLIEGQQGCYLIDSGVSGTEHLIEQYMKSIGKSIKDIKGLFLTHSHPDYIGAANEIKKSSNCKVFAPEKELLE